MNTTLSAKFAAFALALMVNGVLMGSVAYLFSAQSSHAAVAMAATSGHAYVAHGSV